MSSQRLRPTIAPNLPIPAVEYDQQYFNMLTNALRLYFRQNDSDWAAVTGQDGGRFLQFPFIDLSGTVTQTLAAANTPTVITFNTIEDSESLTFSTPSRVVAQYTAKYNVQYSIQFQNTDTSIHNADVWVRVNGVDVARSGSEWAIISSNGGIPGYVVGAANFFVTLNAGDYVELWWASDSTLVSLLAQPAQTTPFTMPAIPAAVLTVNFVSVV